MDPLECWNLSWTIILLSPWPILVRNIGKVSIKGTLEPSFRLYLSISVSNKLMNACFFILNYSKHLNTSIQNIYHKLISHVERSSTMLIFFVASKCYNCSMSGKHQLIKIMFIITFIFKIMIVTIIIIRKHIYENKIINTLINNNNEHFLLIQLY